MRSARLRRAGVAASLRRPGGALPQLRELGEVEIVEMLLDAGADVWLPHVDWLVSLRDDAGIIRAEGHTCSMVPRSVYLEVTAGLAAMGTRWRSQGAKADVEESQ